MSDEWPDISKFRVVDLKDLCIQLGLETKGKKKLIFKIDFMLILKLFLVRPKKPVKKTKKLATAPPALKPKV